jgi:hypothetical protein
MDEKVGVVPVYAFNENQVLFLSFFYCSILTGQMKGPDRLLILLAKTQTLHVDNILRITPWV